MLTNKIHIMADTTQDLLRKMVIDYSKLCDSFNNDIAEITEGENELSEFLFGTQQGIKIREELTSSIFDSFMAASRKRFNPPRNVALKFDFIDDARHAQKVLNSERLEKHLEKEHSLIFSIERKGSALFITL